MRGAACHPLRAPCGRVALGAAWQDAGDLHLSKDGSLTPYASSPRAASEVLRSLSSASARKGRHGEQPEVRCGGYLMMGVAGALVLGATGCVGGGEGSAKPSDTASGGDAALRWQCGDGRRGRGAGGDRGGVAVRGSGREVHHRACRTGTEWGFRGAGTVDGDVCRIYTPVGTPEVELRITWLRSDGIPAGDPAPKFTVLPMGERALTATDGAVIRFACRSGKLTGSAPAHVDIGVERGGMPTAPEGDPDELKDAYATVAHSFSLAMAKELGCENDGGLEPRPSLDPAPR